jgi:HEPN domain-containing protein
MSDPNDPSAWIAKAENDLLNIRNNLASASTPWDTVCYHAQQAAEKMLKAFLVSRGRAPAPVHDLVAILSDCAALDRALAKLEPECRLLARYATRARYPARGMEPAAAEGQAAFAAAQKIRGAILPLLAFRGGST